MEMRHIVQAAVSSWAVFFFHTAQADEWKWSVAPYVWGIDE